MTTKAVHMEATFGTSRYDAAMKRMQNTSKRTMTSIRGHFIGVTVAGAALLASYNKITAAAIEQEQVERRLAAVVRSTGGASGFTAEQMYEMAAGMQAVTTVGDETIIAGQAMLATFKQIRGEAFQRTMMAALDLSDVMQQNLRSSIVMLGKALNDPIANMGALSRAGIQFTATQKETIKTLWRSNRVMEAQAMMLDEIESQFGGAAKAAKTTYGGAVKSLTNTMGDLVEEMGFAVTKNREMVETINRIDKAISEATPKMGKFAKTVVWMLQNIKPGQTMSNWLMNMSELKDILNELPRHPIGPDTPGYEGYANPQGDTGSKGGMGISWMDEANQHYEASQAILTQRQEMINRIKEMNTEYEATQNQAMVDSFALQGEMLQQSYGEREMFTWTHNERMRQLQDEHERNVDAANKRITQIEQQAAMVRMQMAQSVATTLATMAGAGSQEVFAITKAFDIGMAVMSAHTAAAKALAEVPWPYNMAVSAKMLKLGYLQAGLIAATSMGSLMAGGGAGGGGGSGNVSYPETTPPDIINPSENKGSLHIHIEGDIVGDINDSWVDKLVDRVNEASDRSVYIDWSRGSGELTDS